MVAGEALKGVLLSSWGVVAGGGGLDGNAVLGKN